MIKNISQIKRTHQRVCKQIQVVLDQELGTAGAFAQKHVRENQRGYKHRTGKLIQGTKARVVKISRGGRRVIISNSKPYAATVDRGSRAHVIRARRKFLRFLGKSGEWVFARQVNHPGTRPTKFLWNATHATYRVAGPALDQRLMRLHRRV